MLVASALTKYDRLLGKDGYLTSHNNNTYHKMALIKASNFTTSAEQGTSIKSQLDIARKQLIVENRQRLSPIVTTIILCGRQNMSLRGHRDDGALLPISSDTSEKGSVETETESLVTHNEDNFRALLQYRVDGGDTILENHLKSSVKNATYISKTAQNDIITAAGTVIRNKIFDKVSENKFFSVLVDETTDLSKQEQMTICLRYVSKNQLREDFVDNVAVDNMTGEGLATSILTRLGQMPVDLSYMVGQGYDGASAMSGVFNGVQAIILRQDPSAIYVHCSSHCLNLILSTACKLQQIRNTHGIIGEVAVFFNRSAKRVALFKQCVEELAPDGQRTRLVQMCETRWVERHDSVITSVQLYPCILAAIEKCQLLDPSTGTKATMLGHSIQTSEFIVSMVVLESVLAITLTLSKSLQSPRIDLIQALGHIRGIQDQLRSKRDDADVSFGHVWEQAKILADAAAVVLATPRQAARQSHRANIPANTPEEYFRRTIYVPFLDSILQEFANRFEGQSGAVSHLVSVVPSHIDSYSFKDLLPAVEVYSQFVASQVELSAEFDMWKQKWQSVNVCDRPATAVDTLPVCSHDFFPNIHTLLVITATLPVTTATAERTFSSLRLLKSYVRTTMGPDRLAGLTLLYLHRDVSVTVDEVIDVFARQCSRRLEFVLE